MACQRRRVLGILGATVSTGLAGCGMRPGAGVEPAATETPDGGCPGGRTGAPELFDENVLRIGPDDYSGSSLVFQSVAPEPLLSYEFSDVFGPYLHRARLKQRQLALSLTDVERFTHLLPGPDDAADGTRMAYIAFRTAIAKDQWLRDWKLSVGRDPRATFDEREPYRGFSRLATNFPYAAGVAYDEETIIVVPKAAEPVQAPVGERLDRVIDLKVGETRPHHCLYPDVRTLLRRISPADLVKAWFRVDTDTFPADHLRAPDGARASALTIDVWTAETNDTDTAPEAGGTPETSELDLTLTAVFPENEADMDAVRTYVRRQFSHTAGTKRPQIAFENPAYDRSGRVVTVSETRHLTAG